MSDRIDESGWLQQRLPGIEGGVMFTAKDYMGAIQPLMAGLSQLQPDGNSCAICGDSGHQAWECHHNPLVIIAQQSAQIEHMKKRLSI